MARLISENEDGTFGFVTDAGVPATSSIAGAPNVYQALKQDAATRALYENVNNPVLDDQATQATPFTGTPSVHTLPPQVTADMRPQTQGAGAAALSTGSMTTGEENPPASRPQLEQPRAETTTATTKNIVDKKALEDIEAGTQQQTDAIRQKGEAEARAGADAAEIEKKKALGHIAIQKTREAAAQELDASFKKYRDEREKIAAELAQQKIKPMSYIEAGGNPVFAALAIGLGALGQTFAGGENKALTILKQKIDQDLDRQKEDKELTKDRLSELDVSYRAYRQSGMDQMEAKIAAKADALDAYAAEIEARKMQLGSETAMANADQLSGKIKAEAALERAKLLEQKVTTQPQTKSAPIQEERFEVPSDQHRVALANVKMEEALDDLEALRAAHKGDAGALKGRWSGLKQRYGFAGSEAEAVAKSEELSQQILFKLSGTAASDKQAQTIKQFTPSMSSSDEQFAGTMRNLRSGLADERQGMETMYGANPKNIRWPWVNRRDVAADEKDLAQ